MREPGEAAERARTGRTIATPKEGDRERAAVATLLRRPASGRDGGGQAGRSGHGFRPEVEGLRAVALGVVLLYHADVSWLPGGYVGVDVFFVISGFLITGLLVREVDATGRVSLARFYARRARRLLPAALVVLAAVVGLAWVVLSPVERAGVYEEVVAAALYVINWRQASEAVAYSELGAEASPLQHFWSLAVEEQFYLVWPLLIAAFAWTCRRGRRSGRDGTGRDPRAGLAVALGLLAAASFWYAVRLTATQGDAAYFTTTTRAWELAAGGLLALVPAVWWRRAGGRAWSRGLSVGGILAIAAAAYLLTDDSPFPGPWAALPVAGAVAVIAAGEISHATSCRTVVGWLLASPPMRYVGRISYSWYLWHWPLIAFATAWQGRLSSTLLLVVVALSWVPAALTHRLVETPFRRSRRLSATGPALALGGGCTAVGVALGTVGQAAIPTVTLASWSQARGATVLAESTAPQHSVSALRPLPSRAEEDKGRAHADGCLVDQDDPNLNTSCAYGDTSADTTAVLFGDSHALQYFPALDTVARERGWRLEVVTKSGCSPAEVTQYHEQFNRAYTECDEWWADALDHIEELEPSLVVTGNKAVEPIVRDGERLGAEAGAEAMTEGYVATLERLTGTGAEVSIIADNPYPPTDMPSCVSEHLDDLTACAFPRREGLDYEPVNSLAAREVSGVSLLDPTEMFCPAEGTCPAVIGNVLVYRDGTHLTATYTRTMTDWFDRRLPRNLGRG
ncbi:acyltransferase family protein [Streptomyces sp. B22F1]|uniref:acyltransferase family protein n=1 Tax=Streptomyces sp. B22F1 TaxID=3153566 RepID=UPI00325D6586